jgi:hypothetical protein
MGALLLNEWLWPQAPASALDKKLFKPAHLIAAALVWLAVAALLFSSFFSNPAGLLDAAKTYLIWFQRAKGNSPHVHEWSFYWQRLLFFHQPHGPIWSEAIILLLAVGAGIAAFRRRQLPGASLPFVRFLIFYTVILAAIYTALPYKTPWSALGFWHGAILLAGVGAAALPAGLAGRRLKIAAGIILATGAVQLAIQAWQSAINTTYSADPRNPWVYSQTLPNLLELMDKVDAVTAASAEGSHLPISVIAPDSDYWPLPWYLRRYNAAGYFENVPGFSKFTPDGIKDADAFVNKVRANSDPVSKFLVDSGLTNNLDAAPPANGGPARLEFLLVANLNRILTGPSIYDSNRFQEIHLRPETRELLRQDPRGQDLVRLNRRLLEDAYPAELGTNNLPVEPYRPVTILSKELEPDVDQDKAGIMTGYYELRPRVWLELYVQSNVWSAYLQHRTATNGVGE